MTNLPDPVLTQPQPSLELPLIMTAAGPMPTPPATIRQLLIQIVSGINPGYTVLPAGLIEDISSTIVAALSLMDQARIETINSVSPLGANPFTLSQLGQIYGVMQGIGSNATVDVQFYAEDDDGNPLAGFTIPVGVIVSDGTNQYTLLEGTVTQTTGFSDTVTALANQYGTWAIPAGSVNQIVSQIPMNYTVTVSNPQAGFTATGPQSATAFRAQVLQAGLAASQGMGRYLKTLLGNVPGIQPNLVSVRQQTGGGWEIIVGGGDEYAVGDAILRSMIDTSTLTGSVMLVTAFTEANPGVATVDLNLTGFTSGKQITIAGATPNAYNGTFTITLLTNTTFSIGVDTTSFGAYVGGGVVTPNPRNVLVSINDYPDTYNVPIVIPPQQTVTMTVTWNTTAPGFTGAEAIAQTVPAALVAYVNAIAVGQPMILYQLQQVFASAVSAILPSYLLTSLTFVVVIDGVEVSPADGGIIAGDPESYFFMVATGVTVTQG